MIRVSLRFSRLTVPYHIRIESLIFLPYGQAYRSYLATYRIPCVLVACTFPSQFIIIFPENVIIPQCRIGGHLVYLLERAITPDLFIPIAFAATDLPVTDLAAIAEILVLVLEPCRIYHL